MLKIQRFKKRNQMILNLRYKEIKRKRESEKERFRRRDTEKIELVKNLDHWKVREIITERSDEPTLAGLPNFPRQVEHQGLKCANIRDVFRGGRGGGAKGWLATPEFSRQFLLPECEKNEGK